MRTPTRRTPIITPGTLHATLEQNLSLYGCAMTISAIRSYCITYMTQLTTLCVFLCLHVNDIIKLTKYNEFRTVLYPWLKHVYASQSWKTKCPPLAIQI